MLAGAGGDARALDAARDAVGLWRELAKRQPERFSAALAVSLGSFANRLRAVGEQNRALEMMREAVALYRELANVKPSAFLRQLTGCLFKLCGLLCDFGAPARRPPWYDPADVQL